MAKWWCGNVVEIPIAPELPFKPQYEKHFQSSVQCDLQQITLEMSKVSSWSIINFSTLSQSQKVSITYLPPQCNVDKQILIPLFFDAHTCDLNLIAGKYVYSGVLGFIESLYAFTWRSAVSWGRRRLSRWQSIREGSPKWRSQFLTFFSEPERWSHHFPTFLSLPLRILNSAAIILKALGGGWNHSWI